MMSSAPSARSRAAFSAELVAAITVAPASLASCTQQTPTPPDAAEDQDLLAGPHMAFGDHHAAGGTVGAGQRGGGFEPDAVGHPDQLMGAQAAILRQPAMHGFADKAALDPVDRVAEHPVANLPAVNAAVDSAVDPGAERDDLAGDVEAHNRWHRDPDPRHPAAREDVVIIERGGAHAQYDIAVAGDRRGEPGFQTQPVCSMLMKNQGSHVVLASISGCDRSSAARAASTRRSILLVPASGISESSQTRLGCR